MLKPDATKAEKLQAIELLKKYLEGYYLSALDASQKQSVYPPHLETIYDYMSRLGEFQYVLDGDAVRREEAQRRAASAGRIEMDGPAPPVKSAVPASAIKKVPVQPPAVKKQP
jgi:hypothetical protein